MRKFKNIDLNIFLFFRVACLLLSVFLVCLNANLYGVKIQKPIILSMVGNPTRTQSHGIFYRPVVWGNPSHFILEGQLVGDLKFDSNTGMFSTQTGVDVSYFQNEYAQARRIELYYSIRAVNEHGQSAPFPVILTVENNYGSRLPALVDRMAAQLPSVLKTKVGEKIDLKIGGAKEIILGELPPGIRIDDQGNISGAAKEKGRWEALIKIGAEGNAYNTGWAKPQVYSERVASIAFEIDIDPDTKFKQPISLTSATTTAGNLEYLSTQADAGIFPRLVGTKYVRAKVAQNLTHTLQVWPIDKREAVTFEKISGMLPPGLSLDSTTGKIHGIPLSAGSYMATFVAKREGKISPGFSITIKVD
jgi:hypothetical protein